MRNPRRLLFFFFLMIRRPPRSTLDRSSAASDVYKRQVAMRSAAETTVRHCWCATSTRTHSPGSPNRRDHSVSYTHLRAHETVLDLVCRLLLEKKKKKTTKDELRIAKQQEYNSMLHTHTYTTANIDTRTSVKY